MVIAARTHADIEKTAAEIRSVGRKALALPTDVLLNEQVTDMVNKAHKEFGRIDILVNNVGMGPPKPAMEQSERFWETIMRANVTSTFLCSKAVAPVMMELGKGSIINIASVVGRGNVPNLSAYAVSKETVISLTHRLPLEWASHNIRVNAVAPGYVATETAAPFFENDPVLREELKWVPLGRAAKPEDMAGAAVFLASDASSYMTGKTIVVDGSLTRQG